MPKPNHRPLYIRIREALIARLTSGEWKPGTMLPGDAALAAEMAVSHGTMRKAVDSLAADGVLRRHQGKGTFVTEQTPELANYHFFRLVDGSGERVLPEAVCERVTTAPAGAEAARRLGVAEGVRAGPDIDRHPEGVGGVNDLAELFEMGAVAHG